MARLRISAINFLNPAPLLYHFEHSPWAEELAARYDTRYTLPSLCAADLHAGRADLGLIPVAALTEDLAVVPGCTIASLGKVRSILLLLRPGVRLETVETVATDTASRSSLAYTQILFRKFVGTDPEFLAPAPADPLAMLGQADAALLIGDPALLALERKAEIDGALGACTWIDLAEEWVGRTGLPWVAAVWAVRPEALNGETAARLVGDLTASRDAGLAHREGLVAEWTPRIAVPAETIRHYLRHNIHYVLTPECVRAIELFRAYAAEIGALPPLAEIRFLNADAGFLRSDDRKPVDLAT
ncbi:menaquinone biosynthetic enzyme MqnA/MqnD family protein [Granulicella sibirica]|uniref:Chorismate dehydratase n=1 Tax=Granulicella sibirica TaxID=2479048 RepID=A0A4Q0SVC5_9BACT|nr:menaquinone biosynthesis protein [Granulicella sibirica]RXH55025.1 Menaquinone via futalosine step 1 [Granulicella sibirica]